MSCLISCSHEKAKDAIIYSYQRNINGFSANLEEEIAAEIASKNIKKLTFCIFDHKNGVNEVYILTATAEHPKVVSVFLNQGRKLHTTHSWEFMLLEKEGVIHPKSLWKRAKFGEDIIIANLDTGNFSLPCNFFSSYNSICFVSHC